MQIEDRTLDSIRPYPGNPRRNDKAVDRVAASIKNFGFRQPIVVDDKGIIVVGHTRYKAARKLGMETVPVTVMTGVEQSLINQYRIADNRLNEFADWDDGLLVAELEQILMDVGSTDLTGFGASEMEKLKGLDARVYTSKIDTPIYTPRGDRPALSELTDSQRVTKLHAEIDASAVPEELKQFLKQAAERHRVFDFEAIAEYYSHADAETKRLMEASALVIIDIDQAIERGYVQMTDTLREIFNRDHPNG